MDKLESKIIHVVFLILAVGLMVLAVFGHLVFQNVSIIERVFMVLLGLGCAVVSAFGNI